MRTRRSPRSSGAVLPAREGGDPLPPCRSARQSGCTREFYREWANQDVSEAIFEKSRDPRWRLDVFSVEPPALSRFADPYDQDAPAGPAGRHRGRGPLAGPSVAEQPADRARGRDRLSGPARILAAAGLSAAGPPPDRVPAASGRAGLPPNMGVGGVPPSLSSDAASRPGIPFEAFPGMANPFITGTVYPGRRRAPVREGRPLSPRAPPARGLRRGRSGPVVREAGRAPRPHG